MADDCCDSFGGKIYITAGGVRLTPAEGDITIRPTRGEVTATANQDGSASYSTAPRLVGASITFRDGCSITWEDWMQRCKLDVTITEEDNGRQHLFSRTRFVGRPEVNFTNGQVTGISIEGGVYQKVTK